MDKFSKDSRILAIVNELQATGKSKKSIRDKAATLLTEPLCNDGCFMDKIFEFVLIVLRDINKEDKESFQSFALFMDLLSSSDIHFPSQYDISECDAQGLACVSEALIENLEIKISWDDFEISEGKMLSHLLEDILNLFFYYTSYEDDSLQAQASVLVSRMYSKFYHLHSSLGMGLLEYHPQVISMYAQVFDDALCTMLDRDKYYGFSLVMDDMFDLSGSRDDFLRKNCRKILKEMKAKYLDYEPEIKKLFIENIVLEPLNIIYKSQEEVAKNASKYDRDKALLESDFDGYKEAKLLKTVEAINKSLSKDIAYLVGYFRDHPYEALLDELLLKLGIKANRPKLYNQKMKPSVIFKDFAFKLLVIEELMYTQECIQPQMQLSLFAVETKPEIDFEADGYTPIKAVQKYYKNLDISQELLDTVEVLRVGDNYDIWAETYINLWPKFDPGNDVPFELNPKKALIDLELLPSLKKIEGYNVYEFLGEEMMAVLEEKGIAIHCDEC